MTQEKLNECANFLEAEAGQTFEVDFAVLSQFDTAACPYALSFIVILDGVIVKFKNFATTELVDQNMGYLAQLDLRYNQYPSDMD